MITVRCHNILYDDALRFVETEEGAVGIIVEGHAPVSGREDAKGHNLVCAAVSHAGATLVRSLVMVAGAEITYRVDDGYLSIFMPIHPMKKETRIKAETLIESFLIGMLDLRERHGGSISISCNTK